MINLCIVGCGDVIRDRHSPILRDLSKDIHVVAIVSTRQAAFEEVQKTLGYKVKRFDTLDEALQENIDAALVAVPPSSTLDVATYLTRLGIPQYVEKPLGNDVITAAKFIEDVTAKKLPVVVGENFQNQERFSVARSMIEGCNHKSLTNILVRDTLRRGLRGNPHTDDQLFAEQFVHSVSSVRAVTGKSIETILSANKRTVGSITEYTIICELETGVELEIQLSMTNTWSDDRYSFIFDDADIKISHVYSYNTKMYTDTIEHWHGSEDLIKVVTIDLAACGMRKCWDEFLGMVNTKSKKASPSLMNALNDLQVREAVSLSLSKRVSIPVIKF